MIKALLNKIIVSLFNRLSVDTKSLLYTKSSSAHWKNIYDSYREKYAISMLFKFNGVGVSFYGEGVIIISDNR